MVGINECLTNQLGATIMAKPMDFSRWCSRYDAALKIRADYVGGKTCWDTAKYMHGAGISPENAAEIAKSPFVTATQHGWRA
jgi:hypothetical protein